jgi:hypothetical protein
LVVLIFLTKKPLSRFSITQCLREIDGCINFKVASFDLPMMSFFSLRGMILLLPLEVVHTNRGPSDSSIEHHRFILQRRLFGWLLTFIFRLI